MKNFTDEIKQKYPLIYEHANPNFIETEYLLYTIEDNTITILSKKFNNIERFEQIIDYISV